MLKTEKVLLKIEDTIATVTMNRPEKLNALDIELWMGLEEAATAIKHEPNVRSLFSLELDVLFALAWTSTHWPRPRRCLQAWHSVMLLKVYSTSGACSVCMSLSLCR